MRCHKLNASRWLPFPKQHEARPRWWPILGRNRLSYSFLGPCVLDGLPLGSRDALFGGRVRIEKPLVVLRAEPRKLPVVLSFAEVSAVLASAPGPGLKYRAACLGSVQSQDPRHRQQPDADPRRSRKGRQGSQGHAVARISGPAS